MKAVVETGSVETVAIFDPSPEMAAAARELTPEASVVNSLEALLDHELDGIVIASPSALHAAQSIVALEQGVAVFAKNRSAARATRPRRWSKPPGMSTGF